MFTRNCFHDEKKINTFLQRCPSRTEESVYIFKAGLYLQEQTINSTAVPPQSAEQYNYFYSALGDLTYGW